MYAVTVVFTIKPEHFDAFRSLVCQHATRTLEREAGCRRFDVGTASASPNNIFLYELYDDRQAFDVHAATDYMAQFFATATDWIESKEASRWEIMPE